MKLLYCSHKAVYYKNGDYYTTGSWPSFLPALANSMELIYLMTSILNTNHVDIYSLSKFKLNDKLRFEPATNTPMRRVLPIWSIINLIRFLNLQKNVDAVLMAVPSSIPYIPFLLVLNKPLIVLVAGDEQEVIKARRDLSWKISLFSKLAKISEKLLLQKSNLILCRSYLFAENLKLRYALDNIPIRVTLSGVDTAIFRPLTMEQRTSLRGKLGLDGAFVIGFIAQRISISKGADTVIRIFQDLKKDVPELKLILIGNDDIGIPEDESIVHYDFIKREDLPKYYNIFDIFLFPSRSEGAPKVIFEAHACGVPVVSTNVGGIPELIENEITGYIVDPEDINLIQKYCKLLYENKCLRVEMAKKSRENAEKLFSLDSQVELTANEIKSVLNLR